MSRYPDEGPGPIPQTEFGAQYWQKLVDARAANPRLGQPERWWQRHCLDCNRRLRSSDFYRTPDPRCLNCKFYRTVIVCERIIGSMRTQ